LKNLGPSTPIFPKLKDSRNPKLGLIRSWKLEPQEVEWTRMDGINSHLKSG